jgi:preprotein translocase subunit SecB
MATKKKAPAKKKPAGKAGGDGSSAKAAQPQEPVAPQGEAQRQLSVLVQYVKDLSFESPNAPMSLQGPGQNPKIQVNVNVQVNGLGDNAYEVDLHLEAKAADDSGVIYNVELVYGGVFRVVGFTEDLLHRVLFIDCPAILFPFARRVISDMTRDGSFPPLNLDPIDFGGLYQHNLAQQQEQGAPQPAGES